MRAWTSLLLSAALGLGAAACADDPTASSSPLDEQTMQEGDDLDEQAAEQAPRRPSLFPWLRRRDGGVRWPTPSRDAGRPVRDAGGPVDPGEDPGTDPEPEPEPGQGTLPPVTSVDTDGPFKVTIEQGVGPNKGWIARPANLGQDGVKHPIFTWGCGGGSQPSQYRDHLNRLASHGFIVEAHVSTGELKDHKSIIDWLISENGRAGSPYYQKLDTSKIAAGGHSMGSIATFEIAPDPRLTTTIHVAGGSFDGNGYKKWNKPVAIIAGEKDNLATGNATRDYERATVPAWFTLMTGVDHIMAAREGLAPMVAWLRWHLAGETERKAMFIGPNCDFCSGKFKSQSKNW